MEIVAHYVREAWNARCCCCCWCWCCWRWCGWRESEQHGASSSRGCVVRWMALALWRVLHVVLPPLLLDDDDDARAKIGRGGTKARVVVVPAAAGAAAASCGRRRETRARHRAAAVVELVVRVANISTISLELGGLITRRELIEWWWWCWCGGAAGKRALAAVVGWFVYWCILRR